MNKNLLGGSPMVDPEGYLTEEKFEQLLSFATDIRDRALLQVLFYTGRRVSEVVRSLTVNDIDFQDNLINFTVLKKGYPLKVWLNVNSKLMGILGEYVEALALTGDEYLFPISRFRVDQIIKSLGRRAGLEYVGRKKIHAHVFRHSYAVMMAKKVKDIYELKKLQILMGHSNINMTSFYTEHYNKNEMKEFVNREKSEQG